MRETVGGNSLDSLLSEPVPRLVRTIGIPAAVGFLFNTGFNVVDTWYAGMLSTSTLAALSLSFPSFYYHCLYRRFFRRGHRCCRKRIWCRARVLRPLCLRPGLFPGNYSFIVAHACGGACRPTTFPSAWCRRGLSFQGPGLYANHLCRCFVFPL